MDKEYQKPSIPVEIEIIDKAEESDNPTKEENREIEELKERMEILRFELDLKNRMVDVLAKWVVDRSHMHWYKGDAERQKDKAHEIATYQIYEEKRAKERQIEREKRSGRRQ